MRPVRHMAHWAAAIGGNRMIAMPIAQPGTTLGTRFTDSTSACNIVAFA